MKNITLIILLLAAVTSAQTSVSKVVELPEVSQELLYNRANYWVAEMFGKPEEVVLLADPNQGIIKLRAEYLYDSSVFYGSLTTSGPIPFDLELHFKDGRYKYEIMNFVHPDFGLITESQEYPYEKPNKRWRNKVWKDLREKVTAEVAQLRADLEAAMALPLESENSTW